MSRLDSLQQEVLEAFFGYESGFFLTGGAALAGFHLGHRTTKDLDIAIAVKDDGEGFTGGEGQGLTGMRERLAVLGGRLVYVYATGVG